MAGINSHMGFEEALQQARERAAAVNRARLQQTTHAPDPPESGVGGAPPSAGGAKKDKAGSGSGLQQYHPKDYSLEEAKRAAAAALAGESERTAEQVRHDETVAAVERAERERNAVALSNYRNLPLHSRLGMGPSPGTAGTLLQQMQMTELHNRIAFERHYEERMRAAQAREYELAGVSRGQWGHPSMAGLRGATLGTQGAAAAAARSAQYLDLQAEVAAEERWRVQQGLPPLGAPTPSGVLGRAGLHPGAHLAAPRGGIMGARPGPPFEEQSPALRPHVGEVVEQATLGAPAVAPAPEAAVDHSPVPPPKSSGGNALFDLLATAAEAKEREEREAKAGETPIHAASIGHPEIVAPPAKKESKRKRKASNEPKNPLGAFVFYQRKIMADVFEENPCITFGEAAAECGKRWRALPEVDKQEYKDMAAADKTRYTRELATFKGRHGHVIEVPLPKLAKGRPGRPRKHPLPPGATKEPKRAKSAFLFFKMEEMPRVFEEYPNVTKAEASTECAARYKMLSKAEKETYETLAKNDKIRYKKEIADSLAGGGVGAISNIATIATSPTNGHTETGSTSGKSQSDVEEEDDVVSTMKPPALPAATNEIEQEINHWSPQGVQVPTQMGYDAMVDSKPYYVEEEAWRYHNPPLPPREGTVEEQSDEKQLFTYVSHEELRPLPPPPPVTTRFPNSQFCRWSFDEDTRVLHADFRRSDGDAVVTLEDEKFLLEMYEKDDITVVSEGLATGLDREKWTLDYLSRVAGDEYFHKFRRFDKHDPEEDALNTKKSTRNGRAESVDDKNAHGEVDKCLSMKVKDYVAYLRTRGEALDPDGRGDAKSPEFAFKDHDGKDHTIDVKKTVLYMLDFDMVKLVPTLNEDFTSSFKLRETMPGGAHCMMNCVNANGRPFMGPNMYITPPGSFTHFHQDGHGTVDSGHLCLSGYNEVVMLRRLPERHKRHALRFLTGSYKSKEHSFEALYNLPHGDGLGDKPQWPNNEAVAHCNAMNYCVSRFILKPGQCVHINKGRLHAFRKLSNEQLPPTDCHAKLRRDLCKPGSRERVVGPGKPEVLCISVAYDWMFRGVTAEGINREILTSIECAALNRKYGVLSLAIPELSLMQMARTLAPKPEEGSSLPGAYRESLLAFDNYSSGFETFKKGFMPSTSTLCKGIFPALQYVIKQHIYAMNVAERLKSNSKERHKRVSVVERPNAWENPITFALDPYGNTDFFCKLCHKELSNVYLHCIGCEVILSKDFNICLECHQEKRYAKPVQMHPLNNKRHSTINHIGNYTFDRVSRCPCKNGPVCRHCNYCAGCSCRCHTWFSLHFRFLKKGDELQLLHRVKRQVSRAEIDAAEEAEKRLSMAVRGAFDESKDPSSFGLHSMDVLLEDPAATEEVEEQEDESVQSGEDAVKPEPPKRKSRRLGNEEPEAMETTPETAAKPATEPATEPAEEPATEPAAEPAVEPVAEPVAEPAVELTDTGADDEVVAGADVDSGAASNGKTEEIANRDDSMQVNVDDMKVTIRYRTGEWTETERGDLRRALKEEPDWEKIVSKCPERGSDQVRKYALEKFPTLAKALKDRGIERMEITQIVPKNDAMELEDQPVVESTPPEVATDKTVVRSDSNADNAKTNGAVHTVETKGVPVVENEKPDPEGPSVEPVGKRVRVNSGKWDEVERARLKLALEDAVADVDSMELIIGTRRYPQIRSYAPRTFPDLWEGYRERLKAKEENEAKSQAPKQIVPAGTDEAEAEKPVIRRTSSRRQSEESKNDDEGDSIDTEREDEEEGASPKAQLVAGESKLKLLSRAKKSQMLTATQSTTGRGRRASQDLSTGRKRRNSASSNGSSKQADNPAETSSLDGGENGDSTKRQKMI